MTDKPLVPIPSALLKGKAKPDLVDVPDRTVLSIGGEGSPDLPGFAAAIGALYGIAYTIRFSRKAAGLPVFKVGALEGEWRAAGNDLRAGVMPSPADWRWTLRMGVPEDVTEAELGAAVKTVTAKPKGGLADSPEARRVGLEKVKAGRFARILHVGPYASEPESFAKIGALLEEKGLRREPWHLEIYLSHPGRTPAEKLKTVLLVRVR